MIPISKMVKVAPSTKYCFTFWAHLCLLYGGLCYVSGVTNKSWDQLTKGNSNTPNLTGRLGSLRDLDKKLLCKESAFYDLWLHNWTRFVRGTGGIGIESNGSGSEFNWNWLLLDLHITDITWRWKPVMDSPVHVMQLPVKHRLHNWVQKLTLPCQWT